MQDIIYHGKKALLLETPDLCEIDAHSKIGNYLKQKLTILRVDGYEYLLVLSDLSHSRLPKAVTEILSERRTIYVGSLT